MALKITTILQRQTLFFGLYNKKDTLGNVMITGEISGISIRRGRGRLREIINLRQLSTSLRTELNNLMLEIMVIYLSFFFFLQDMLNFTRDYKLAVKELLDQGLSNTDQEVIYAMYSAKMRKPHYMKIKPYICHPGQLGLRGSDSRYFCLGYVCKKAWEKRVPSLTGAVS